MDTQQASRLAQSWATGGPVMSPFAHPVGLRGRLAGRFMQWTNTQDDVLGVLDLHTGHQVLEVGYGPGALIRLLARRSDAGLIHGVDPSPVMRDLAIRNNRAAARAGRVRLGLGSAEHTGLLGQSVDRVVTVNNVAIWPDLQAGVREIQRVLRPGGIAVIAWHGGTSPSQLTRRLRLADDKLNRIEEALKQSFSTVTRQQLRQLDVFKAVR